MGLSIAISIVWVWRCTPDRSPHCQRVSSTQLQRGLGHIEHCRTQLASRPAVCRTEDESSIKRKKKQLTWTGGIAVRAVVVGTCSRRNWRQISRRSQRDQTGCRVRRERTTSSSSSSCSPSWVWCRAPRTPSHSVTGGQSRLSRNRNVINTT